MKLKLKVRYVALALSCVVMASMGITASATSINWNVTLKPLGGNATLIDSTTSSSSTSYATNQINSMGGDYTAMDVWMTVNGTKTYGKTRQYLGAGSYTMTMGGDQSKGTSVAVYAENASNVLVNVSASGYCNIH